MAAPFILYLAFSVLSFIIRLLAGTGIIAWFQTVKD